MGSLLYGFALTSSLLSSGSKCPTGEFLYTLNTDDNKRVKTLFNDLSQHKPIFTDDRLGRRMAIDIHSPDPSTLSGDGQHPARNREPPDRYILQQTIPEYENRQVITETFNHNPADPLGITAPSGRRHSSVDEQIFNPSHKLLEHVRMDKESSRSIEDLTNRNYQNIFHTPMHSGGRRSPQKISSSGVMPEQQVPVGYYNVSPPFRVLKKKHSRTFSPPRDNLSSPEDEEPSRVPLPQLSEYSTPPIGEERGEGLNAASPATVIEGDQLVVVRGGSRGSPRSPPFQDPPLPPREQGLYQNLEFMKPMGSVRGGGVTADEGERLRK